MSNKLEDLLTKSLHRWRLAPDEFVEDTLRISKINPDYKVSAQQKTLLVAAGNMVLSKWKVWEEQSGGTLKVPMNELERQYAEAFGLSVMAGKGVGKDAVTAWLVLWFLVCFDDVKILVTAPKSDMIKTILWSEISKWHQARLPNGERAFILHECIKIESEKIYKVTKENPGKRNFAIPKIAQKNSNVEEQKAALSGEHSEYMLVIADEACHDDQTEVLTSNGWKYFKDVTLDDLAMTMDVETGVSCYEKPLAKTVCDYDGEMYYYKDKTSDFAVTPNHEFMVKSRKTRRWGKRKIKDIGKVKFTIPKTAIFNGSSQDRFIVPGKADCLFHNKRKPLSFDFGDWCELVGWFVSEGSINYHHQHGGPSSVAIAQTIDSNRRDIIALLERMGIRPSVCKRSINICDVRIAIEMSWYGEGFKDKYVPSYIKDAKPCDIKRFLSSFEKGDGYRRENRSVYYTSSPQLADDIQELCMKIGVSARLTKRKIEGNRKWIKDHWATSSCDGYVIATSEVKKTMSVFMPNVERKRYAGKVYCLTVPSGMLLTRRNGVVLWSGNSGVPDAVFEPLENTLTRMVNFALLIGNPNKASGFFYGTHFGDAKTRKKWIPFQWNAEESDIVSSQQIENMREKYGEDSDNYRVNVLGLPPAGGEGTLIPYSWVYDASVRESEVPRSVGRVLGVDVAGSGVDKTVLLLRQGPVVVDILKLSGLETEPIVNHVLGYAYDNDVDAICIDAIGVGAGVYSYVKKSFPRTHGVVVSRSARRSEKFVNLRSELWWRCREFFEDPLASIPDDKELLEQLADIHYESEMHGGKISVEKKRDLKRRKGANASPDIADALCLSLYIDDRALTVDKAALDPWGQRWSEEGGQGGRGYMSV